MRDDLFRAGDAKPGTSTQWLVALVAAGLVGYPLVQLVRASVAGPPGSSASAAWGSIGGPLVGQAIAHTVVVSLLATVFAVVLGFAMALATMRSDLPGRHLLGALWMAPLVIPAYVVGLAWLEAYGGSGVSAQWWHLSAGWVSGPVGVTLLLGVEGCPLAYLLLRAVLSSERSIELEEAARAAGATPLRVLLDVTLPLVRSAMLGASLLVLVASASDFGVPAVLGIPARFSTITTAIYGDLSFEGGANAIGSATALSTLLGALALVVIVAVGRFLQETNPLSSGRATDPSEPLLRLGALRPIALFISWAFVALTAVLPLVALVLEAVGNGFQLSAWPGHWGAGAFRSALSGEDLVALGRSVLLATCAGITVSLGGAAVAYVARRGPWAMRLVSAVIALPFALPGSVLAIAVLLAWQRWLYGTLGIILLAYVARFAVVGLRTADAGLATMGEELVEAGRASGAGGGRVLLDLVAPTLAPSLWASFGLVFLLAIHELTMSSLLYGPNSATFAVTVLDAEEAGSLALTAASALVVTAITVAGALVVLGLRHRIGMRRDLTARFAAHPDRARQAAGSAARP